MFYLQRELARRERSAVAPAKATGDFDNKAKASGNWSLITRADGSKQWAYKGRPLYTWAKDEEPGQAKGNSFEGNSWHVAKP